MVSPEFCATMARYSAWMNERLGALCDSLPDAERRRDRGAPFGSIHGNVNHLLLADRIWLARFEGRPYPVRGLDQEVCAGWEALRAARAETDGEIAAWVARLTPERLAGELRYTSIVQPAPRSTPLWLAVQHFFNHQTHHRGQLTALLEQAGLDVGVTDLIGLPGVAPVAPPGRPARGSGRKLFRGL